MRKLKAGNTRLLHWAFGAPRRLFVAIVRSASLAAGIGAYLLPRAFLPPFNEGTILVNLQYNPGISLAESNRLGAIAERLIMDDSRGEEPSAGAPAAPSSTSTPRASTTPRSTSTWRARSAPRRRSTPHIRAKLAVLPVSVAIGQPIAHRLDHMLSGVQAQIAVKIFGEDLDTLRSLGRARCARGCSRCPASSTCRSRSRC